MLVPISTVVVRNLLPHLDAGIVRLQLLVATPTVARDGGFSCQHNYGNRDGAGAQRSWSYQRKGKTYRYLAVPDLSGHATDVSQAEQN